MDAARLISALAVGLALSALAVPARADPDPDAKARAAKLFEEGRVAAKAGDYAHACDRFDKSYALDPAPGTEMNLGDCFEHQDKLRKAWRMFDAAARELDRLSDNRATFAHERADKLLAKLVTVVVRIAAPLPAGLALTIDKHAEPAVAEVRDVVEPGTVEVVATAPDKAAITRTATGEAGGTVTLELAFVGDDATPKPEEPAAASGHRRTSWVHAAIGVGGAGAAVEITGLVFGLAARSAHQDALANGCTATAAGLQCNPAGASREADAGHLADIGTVLTIGGGALLAAGVIVFFAAPRDAEEVHVAPMAGAHVVGITLGRAF